MMLLEILISKPCDGSVRRLHCLPTRTIHFLIHPGQRQPNRSEGLLCTGPPRRVARLLARCIGLPKQKRVTQQIMPRWMPHVHSNQVPPDDLCNHLRKLHLTQVVEAGDPRHSMYFTPAAWLSCPSTSDGVMVLHMAFTKGERQNWF